MRESLKEIFKNKVYVVDKPANETNINGIITGYITTGHSSYFIALEKMEYELHTMESTGLTLMFDDDKTRNS